MTGLVIFDCDGVLVDSEHVTNVVLIQDLATYGLTVTMDEAFDLFVGGTMAGVADTVRGMGVDLPPDWVDRIYAKMYARLEAGVSLVPGVLDVIEELENRGIPHCVASNGSEQKMQITLGQNGLWDRLQGRIFSAKTLGVAKPAPDLFLAAASQFGVAPQDCLVIEDSVSGATAAKRAGMRCLGYAPIGDGAKLSALGATVIRDMARVVDHLNPGM